MSTNGLPKRRTQRPAVSLVVQLSCLIVVLSSITSCGSLSGTQAPSPMTGLSQGPVVAPTHTATFVSIDASRTLAPTATFAPIPTTPPIVYVPIPTSTPTPTPTVTPTPTPTETPTPGAGVTFKSLSSPVRPGGTARADVVTTPKTRCTIKVVYKGATSNAAGLGPKTSDDAGTVSWSWKVATNTPKGSWPVTVTCGSTSATKSFTVQ